MSDDDELRNINQGVIYHVRSLQIPLADMTRHLQLAEHHVPMVIERIGDCPRGYSHACSACPHLHVWNSKSVKFDCYDLALSNTFLRRRMRVDPSIGKGRVDYIVTYQDAILMEWESELLSLEKLNEYMEMNGLITLTIEEAESLFGNLRTSVVNAVFAAIKSGQIFIENQALR